jgi:ABC-type branched-subunit amino acid transport system substrate-binding protein
VVPGQEESQGSAVTQTPLADASELGDDLRVQFLAMVGAGDDAFARDEDAEAIRSWTAALELIDGQSLPSLRDSVLARVVVAHARGGGAEAALSLYDELPDTLQAGSALRFARARALEREGRATLQSLAAWFDAWAAAAREEEAAGRHYARLRAESIWSQIGRESGAGEALLAEVRDEEGRVCAALFTGTSLRNETTAAWVGACLPGVRGANPKARSIGILLPRTGRLAALADTQLATLATAMRLTSPDQQSLVLEFEDAGSDAASAAAGARRLVDAGATTIVGPVGARQTRAVVEAVGGRARIINPGPPVGGSEGVAPTLEDRVEALARVGLDEGCASGWTLLHATGGYGTRGERHFKSLSGRSEFAGLGGTPAKLLTYSPSETSFAKLLRSDPKAVSSGRCVLIIDTLSRTGAIARQLRRDGVEVGPKGVRLYSTAEGLDARAIMGEGALAGVTVAPVALPLVRSTFQESYELSVGKPADDQALLLWAALRRAVWADGERGVARVARFDERGRLDVSTKK